MKKYKDVFVISEMISDKVFDDIIISDINSTLSASKILLFAKDIHYLNEPHNKISLIIIDGSNYVINNDFRFNCLEVVNTEKYDEYNFYSIYDNKRSKIQYFLLN